MSNIQVFNNEEFGKVRTIVINGIPHFVGKDVAESLGYKNTRDAISRHVDSEDKAEVEFHDGSQNRKAIGINESGLYSLILSSELPNAKKFKRWVIGEVLPSIRKHGAYMTETVLEQAISNPDFAIGLLQSLKQTNEENKKLREDVKYKTNIIEGLVDDIDLATKRQRLQQIMRYDFQSPKQMSDKWNLLYSEFEKKYHINLNSRLKSEKTLEIKPKIKNKLDYIDRVLGSIPEIYELACKIFEGNVESLKEEWFSVVQK